MNSKNEYPFSWAKIENNLEILENKGKYSKATQNILELKEKINFDEILENFASNYLEELKKIDEPYLECALNIRKDDDMFTDFPNYFKMMFFDIIFNNFNFSENQKKELKQKIKPQDVFSLEDYFSGLLHQAFLDIFLLKILQKKYDNLTDKKIKHILEKNMFLSWALRWNIFTTVFNWIKKQENLEKILENLENLNYEKIPFQKASCPFFYTKNQKKWIFEMMKFFDEKIIPKIPEDFHLFH